MKIVNGTIKKNGNRNITKVHAMKSTLDVTYCGMSTENDRFNAPVEGGEMTDITCQLCLRRLEGQLREIVADYYPKATVALDLGDGVIEYYPAQVLTGGLYFVDYNEFYCVEKLEQSQRFPKCYEPYMTLFKLKKSALSEQIGTDIMFLKANHLLEILALTVIDCD
jgi:hypothetical protein